MLRPILFLGAITSLANPSAGIGAVVRPPPPRPRLLLVQSPRQRVIFGPLAPARARLFPPPPRPIPVPRLLLVQPPRLVVPFTGWPPGPKIFAAGRRQPARPLLLQRLPPAAGPFGPCAIPRVKFSLVQQRPVAPRLLLVQPPRKPYFFQSGPLMTPQIGRAAGRPVPARLLLQPLPRLVVTFAPGITRPIQIGRIGSRPLPVRLLLVGPHQLAPAQPAFDPIATILPDVGFAAVIIDN